jgi:hypothetical protein
MLSTVANSSGAKAAVAQLPLYEKMKAMDMVSMYLSPEQNAFYEYLSAKHHAGANPDDLVAAGSRYRPEEAKRVASESMNDAMDKLLKSSEPGTGLFGSDVRGTKFRDYMNQPMVKAAARKQLRALMIANGNDVDAAVAGVRGMLGQQWMPVELNGRDVLIPRVGRNPDGSRRVYDPAVLNHTLTYLSETEAPKAAKAAGVANYKTARFRIVQLPGADAEVEIVDEVGNPIAGTNTVPLSQVYGIAEQEYRERAYQSAAAEKAAAEKRRTQPATANAFSAGRMH